MRFRDGLLGQLPGAAVNKTASAAADQRYDLQLVAIGEGRRRMFGSWDNFKIAFHGDVLNANLQRSEQIADRRAIGQFAGFAVYRNLHREEGGRRKAELRTWYLRLSPSTIRVRIL